jgi:hypothetical protein
MFMSMFLAASEAYRRTVNQGNASLFCGDIPEGEPDKEKSDYVGEDGEYALRDAEGKPLAVAKEDGEGDIQFLRFPEEWPSSVLLEVEEE